MVDIKRKQKSDNSNGSSIPQSPITNTAIGINEIHPHQQQALESSIVLKSTLKGLKDNYQQIEQQIVNETKVQRAGQQAKYQGVLERLHTLKKLLKAEVEQRKNAEDHFKQLIEDKADGILQQFTVQYLNQMHVMHETVGNFHKRREQLEVKRQSLKKKIDIQLRDKREQIVNDSQAKQVEFENAYQEQVDCDIKALKNIGELEYNYENMTQKITTTRQQEFSELKTQIMDTIRSNEIYEQEEATRKLLIGQVNMLKHQLKMEMENRQTADNEIQTALNKYKEIIVKQVSAQRQEIKKNSNDAMQPKNDPSPQKKK